MTHRPPGRKDLVFADKDRALRRDVRTLGKMVGELLREQGGDGFYERVEKARREAILRREGERSIDDLARVVGKPDASDAQNFIRAFSTYFQLVNTAEKVHRIRRRREYMRENNTHQPHGAHDLFQQFKDAGCTLEEIRTALENTMVEPVFTAHPTEPTRRTILRKEQRIVRKLVDLLDPGLPPQEVNAALAVIRAEVTSGWQTEEHPSESMTVADELEHVLFFLTDVIYRVIPPFYENLRDALEQSYGEEAASAFEIPLLTAFASWVGGDMDGNPNVGAKTIRNTLARQRGLILDLYFRECADVAGKLSQCRDRVEVSDAIDARIDEYRHHFSKAWGDVPNRHRDMPYRAFLKLIQARLQSTYDDDAFPYESAEEFAGDVDLIAQSLTQNKGQNAGLFAVRRLQRRIECFGFHMATLDIRQDALVHREVIGKCLGDEDWLSRSADDRLARLCEAITSREAPVDTQDTQVRKTLAVFQSIAFCHRKYGKRSIGPYIISMTQGADDVVSVLLLAQWAELGNRRGEVPLDIAPLLETVDDLDAGPGIMQALLANPVYRKHLERRKDRQTIMIGYSDSNKDGGIASARWALHQAQAALRDTLAEHDIELTLFHGRGGTVSRGGSKMHDAVRGAPAGTVAGRMRFTEQGEIINEKYGLRGIAMRTLEQSAASVAAASLLPAANETVHTEWSKMMSTVAQASRDKYQALTRHSDGFFQYFREATPIDVIERMRIGSRPASRREQKGINDLRAIPWVFAWTQARFVLPGWYGLGTGLEAAVQEFGAPAFSKMMQDWHFVRALMADAEMVLAKSDLEIAERYSMLAGDLHEQFFPTIKEEFDKTLHFILELSNASWLLDADKTLQRTIMLRNPYIDPMSLLQIDLLDRWRAGSREDDALLGALLASVNGIAQGLQNTG
ncbi:MAG: phosphoenolpyruvate carboxylase [Pseudomonadota bacterium]